MNQEHTAEIDARCTCAPPRRTLPPRGWGYRPSPACPVHSRRSTVPPRPPGGSGGGSGERDAGRLLANWHDEDWNDEQARLAEQEAAEYAARVIKP